MPEYQLVEGKINNESESSRGKVGRPEIITNVVLPFPSLSLDVLPPDIQSVSSLRHDPSAVAPRSSESPAPTQEVLCPS